MGRTMVTLLVATATIALCVSALAANPQDPTSSTPPQDHSKADSSTTAEITLRGCVSGGKRFTFMQASTGAMFELTGKTDRVVSSQGKLVEISATEFAAGGESDELPKLQVHYLRVVADKCPIQARPPSANQTRPSTGQHPPGPEPSPSTRPYADPGTVNQAPPAVQNPNIEGDTGAPSPGTGNPPPPNPNANNPPNPPNK
jgi:hypothetical protein